MKAPFKQVNASNKVSKATPFTPFVKSSFNIFGIGLWSGT